MAYASHDTILKIIMADHRGMLRLHKQLSETQDSDMKQRILNTLIREIATHSALEETVVYPMIETKQNKGVADQMRAEHLAVKEALYQVDQIGYVTDPKIMGLLNQVMTRLTQHIEHEEKEEMPRLESMLTADEQKAMISKWNMMRPTVPTRPHPSAPDRPPMEIAAAAVATPMDKMKDMARSFVEVDKS